MKKIFTLLAVSLSLFGAQIIEITKQQQNDLGVKTQVVTSIDSISVGPYNAIVTLDKRDIISVGSSVDAVVKNIYVRKLDHVKKGEKIFTIYSESSQKLKYALDIEKIMQAYQIKKK